MLKESADIKQVAADILGFLKSFIAEIMAILAKFEKHFTFTEAGYNDYPVDESTTA